MFDPQTTELIHQAPKLPEFDLDRLPQELTKAFAAIVAFRVRLTQGQEALPEELFAKLDELRRLATTFEGMVALQVEHVDRRAAAFVAAQAYQLLHLVRVSIGQNMQCQHPLRENAIAPEVSALLLYLIANQPSDAMEMARLLAEVRPRGDAASTLLIDALTNLAAGQLDAICGLEKNIINAATDDSVEVAVEALYGRILNGITILSRFLLHGHKGGQNLVEEAKSCFCEVQQLAIQVTPWPFEMTEATSIEGVKNIV